jgi:hypothetical protein
MASVSANAGAIAIVTMIDLIVTMIECDCVETETVVAGP